MTLENIFHANIEPNRRSNTIDQGYIRQALYACKTSCFGDDEKQAGVCLACSFRRHKGHEFIDLYTKRSFRCDCGDSNFGNKKCILDKAKARLNIENKHTHNGIDGIYCICSRLYPYRDPDSPEEIINDQMMQCIICKNWYY
ncbi:putative E3 ubiquitin-protein ligase UBR7 [Aphidius gifuensis]|uniref:putative E3 ubiquitin-protein ligase UBR7 n=1 Tax=Aphidius gifuensis TaxID=684658 RepID=UPI001CDB7AAF|nr:putative E3 ubiquitin-protein ligase UBR7 [Aphidius gifuensis]XP_044015796.1 putative E3 ubiquitin-protein ligase UBR7 [Aphidius gifuensis]